MNVTTRALLGAWIASCGLAAPAADSTSGSGGDALSIRILPAPSTEVGLASPADEAPMLECEVARGAPLPLSAVAFSPDGKTLAVGGLGEVVLWDLAEGKLARRIAVGQATSMVRAVVLTGDGAVLAAGQGAPYQSGIVTLLDLKSGQAIAELKEPKGQVNCLALSPDGKLLVAGCGDAAAYVWGLDDKKLVATLEDHSLQVLSAAFGDDGKFLVTGGADAMVQSWDTESWKPDIRRTTVGGEVRRCMIRRSDTRRQGGSLHTFGLLIGGREDRTLRVMLDGKAQEWQRSRGDYHAEVKPGVPLDCVWVPKRSDKAWVACSDGTIKVFADAGQKITHTATLRGHGDWVYGLALSPDAARLVSASADGTVKLWSTQDNRLLATLVQLSPRSDEWLAVASGGWHVTSSPGAVKWRTANLDVAPEKLAALAKPEAVQQALAGQPPAAPVP